MLRADLCYLFPPNRFEWDIPLEEAHRRKLEAYIKNGASFMSRPEPIGKVQNAGVTVGSTLAEERAP